MTKQEAITILTNHNKWRRGDKEGQANPTQLGIAIDTAIELLSEMPQQQIEQSCDNYEHKQPYEPYFGWCDVEGCNSEGSSGGCSWRETGYWTTCMQHGIEYRGGKPCPPMKQSAIDREKRRDANGYLQEKSCDNCYHRLHDLEGCKGCDFNYSNWKPQTK